MGSIAKDGDKPLANVPAPGAPYFTPAQNPPAGTPLDLASAPTLFQPYQTRGVKLHNRLVVSPMCTYSSDNGHLTDFHLVHLGQFALAGAGLVIVEASSVEARGRISPEDSGLWTDSQIAPLKKVVDFIHSQGGKAGIQLAHAGRKASTIAPWIGGTANKVLADESLNGWPDDVVSASAIPYDEGWAVPKELTVTEIKALVQSFVDAAKRAVAAGIDVIEIHGAHGYLITQFLSPVTNVSAPPRCSAYESTEGSLVLTTSRNAPTTTAAASRTAPVSCARSSLPSARSSPRTCRSGCASRPRSGWTAPASRPGTSSRASSSPSCSPGSASTSST